MPLVQGETLAARCSQALSIEDAVGIAAQVARMRWSPRMPRHPAPRHQARNIMIDARGQARVGLPVGEVARGRGGADAAETMRALTTVGARSARLPVARTGAR
jgi:hypothetical protein